MLIKCVRKSNGFKLSFLLLPHIFLLGCPKLIYAVEEWKHKAAGDNTSLHRK
jgi:hypothetical protein